MSQKPSLVQSAQSVPGALTPDNRLRNAIVVCVGDDIHQLSQPIASNRRNKSVLGHMSADGIGELGALADQHQPDAVKPLNALLHRALDLDKAHRWPCDRLTDRFGISCIVLLSLHIRLHVARRH